MELLANPKYPERNGMVRFPGGGIDPGEDAHTAAVREMKEELGVDLRLDQLHYVGTFTHPEWGHPEVFFHCPDHPLKPGTFLQTEGGDKGYNQLVPAHPGDKNYFGPDVTQAANALLKPIKAV